MNQQQLDYGLDGHPRMSRTQYLVVVFVALISWTVAIRFGSWLFPELAKYLKWEWIIAGILIILCAIFRAYERREMAITRAFVLFAS